jgi:cytochrome c-type biogenesis protein CcmH
MRSIVARWILLAVCLLPLAASAIDKARAFEDDALQARYEKIIDEVRCLTCQNQTIKDSNAMLAEDLRREIREQIAAGASDDEVYDFLYARYGDFALYRPRMSGRTLLLWFAPVLLLAIGGFSIARVVLRRSRLDPDADGA